MLEQLSISADVSELLKRYFSSEQGGRLFNCLPEAMQQEMLQLAGEQRVSYQLWWRVLDKLQLIAAQPALGLRIASFVALEDFGCLGYLFKTSADLGQALQGLISYQRLLYDGNQAMLQDTNPDLATTEALSEIIWSADYGYSNQISDELLVAGLLNIMGELSHHQNLGPHRIDFPHHVKQEFRAHYTRFFKCPVQFNQPNLRLVFNREYLMLPLSGADKALHQLMEQQADTLLGQVPNVENEQNNLLFHIQSVLLSLLQQGEPTAVQVAKKLNISVRTLHRRLKQEHQLLFREVLKQTRMQLARQLLSDGARPLSEIALMLGYSEQSAFSRGFYQWFGITPSQYQQDRGEAKHPGH